MSAIAQRARPRPSTAPTRLDHSTRARIEAAIERLIAVLDRIDGDPDLEDGHDAEVVNEDGDLLDDGEFDETEAAERSRRTSVSMKVIGGP